MSKRSDLEGPIQQAIVAYLRQVLPSALVHHARNEINKRGLAIQIELAKAKRRGVVAGFPDIIALTKSGALFFEVKAEGNYASPAQKAVHAQLEALGYPVAVVRSIDDVRECLAEWGVDTRDGG
jgi:hypothetical protein